MGFAPFRQFAQLGRHFGQTPALDLFRIEAQQLAGAVVDGGDPSLAVQADHARADARQDRFDEEAASLGLVRSGLERRLLGLDVLGHPVEGFGQDDDLGRRAVVIDARIEVAARHLIRRPHQPSDRRRDRTGGRHGQPDRPDQHQQRRFQIAERKGSLDASAAFLGGAIGGDGLLTVAHSLDQARRQRPHDVEIGVTVIRQRIERPHHVRVLGHRRRRHLAARHRLEGLARRGDIGRRARLLAAGQDASLLVQNIEGRVAEEVADLRQSARELDPIVEQIPDAAQLGRHRLQVHLKPGAHVRDIGAADLGPVLDS
ncbi:hypothetical protein D3C73_1005170 [compost metagenome]